MASPRNLSLACVPRLLSSDYWPTSPPVWQSRTTMQHLPALQKKNIVLWGYPVTPNEDQRTTTMAVHQIHRLTRALIPFLTQPEPGAPGPSQTAGRTLSTSSLRGLRSSSLPNLGFQDLDSRTYLQSLPRVERDAEIRTPSPWQDTLWLACCPTFSVVESSVAHEAPPCSQATLVTNTHCDPQPDQSPQVRPLSGWMKR